MKLLFITQIWDEGDSVLGFVPAWVRALHAVFTPITIIALRASPDRHSTEFPVYSLGKEKGKGRISKVWKFYRLVWKLRNSYDAVFVHMNPEYIILAGPLWRLMGKKVVLWYAHGTVTWKLRLASVFASRILTSTPEGCRINSKKLRIVGQAIDTVLFQSVQQANSQAIDLVVVGRVSASKGQYLTLQAVHELRKNGYYARLTIIGAPIYDKDYEYQHLCEDYIQKNELSSFITFTGAQSRAQLAHLLPTMSLCVNMSSTGSLDKAGLEALVSGVPVITANNAFRSVIAGITPELMLPKTELRGLVDAIRWYIALPQDRKMSIITALKNKVLHEHSLSTFAQRVADAI